MERWCQSWRTHQWRTWQIFDLYHVIFHSRTDKSKNQLKSSHKIIRRFIGCSTTDKMKIYLLTIGDLPLAFAATGSFSYKPDSDKGPTSWGSLDLGPDVDNQCGGSSQSGIDVPTSSCGTTGDYSFSVRIWLILSSMLKLRVLLFSNIAGSKFVNDESARKLQSWWYKIQNQWPHHHRRVWHRRRVCSTKNDYPR